MDETSSSRKQGTSAISREQWQLVTHLFDQSQQLSAAEREELLASADATVAEEVRSLLLNSEGGPESSISPMAEILSPPRLVPEQIGKYKIERMLGQGGMGTVFLAHRVDEFDQLVAVKLTRRDFGPAAHALERRFRQERQILASLQHPYIAHLIDGGTCEGFPYLVVQYIPGLRIDEYCNRNRLSLRQRIELFLKICAAVQYAHQSLVIHLDLKPANVLILPDGTPKLLDFGVARLLRDDDTAAELTGAPTRAFTPTYASPEQLRGEPVGTGSDVYSLGVMLYELLTGLKPYDVNTESEFAVLDAISRQPPPIASAAIQNLEAEEREEKAAERAIDFATWGKTLRRELDLILSTALAPDRARRYQSVEQLAADLTRYLADLPIAARKDTWGYRAQKFLSRHAALTSVVAVAAVVIVFSWAALWRANRIANQQRQQAERRFNELHSLARSNITEVQDALDRVQGGTEVRALILRRAAQYLDGLSAEQGNDLGLQRDLASAYQLVGQRLGNPASSNLGDFDAANANYDRSVRIREAILKSPQATENDRFQLIYARYHQALMQNTAGHLEAARQTLQKAATSADAMLAAGPRDMTLALSLVGITHRALASLLRDNDGAAGLGDAAQALVEAQTADHASELAYKRNPNNEGLIDNVISARGTLAMELIANGREAEGMELSRQLDELIKASRAKLTARSELLLAFARYERGLNIARTNPQKGLPYVDEALAVINKAHATDPADRKSARWYAIGQTTVGNIHRRAGERQKGLSMMEDGMTQLRALIARNSPPLSELQYALATGLRGLGDDAREHGKPAAAIAQYEAAEQVYADDAAAIPEDLDVYCLRAENELSLAAAQAKMGLAEKSAASRRLAMEYAQRVLTAHPDNVVARRLLAAAEATK